MSDIHILELCKTKTQKEIGEILGVTQGAVFQALAAKRDIYFRPIVKLDGSSAYDFYEIKKPRRKKVA